MGLKTHFMYPVVVERAEDGGLGLYFPDFPGTAIMTPDIASGLKQAKEMLVIRLLEIEEKNEAAPAPSDPDQIELLDSSDRIVFVEVFMPPYRDEAANKAVTKNCTLPKWLRDAAEDAGLNFSQVLQNSLKDALGINKRD
ncbi:type II toxin-antitoxin system HicB family antitoxin [Paenibacillus validus]|uniref:type II toxin-antitoxin system HicB family antitoxin n=1 Tax=Paenibacillus validus TaxID=44253 RepID=UPI000FDBB816|nr:type II toxin-antitoxin system HicB family antitoxin [Paenibacillus validus]MED4599854.1 type II toxin-antitoxin system HicB family antitoxin [Paenibacillus validus]MED4606113.1 type II toxin-antitoxin system HicB family antitoxin [Paenibacillus validus]